MNKLDDNLDRLDDVPQETDEYLYSFTNTTQICFVFFIYMFTGYLSWKSNVYLKIFFTMYLSFFLTSLITYFFSRNYNTKLFDFSRKLVFMFLIGLIIEIIIFLF